MIVWMVTLAGVLAIIGLLAIHAIWRLRASEGGITFTLPSSPGETSDELQPASNDQ